MIIGTKALIGVGLAGAGIAGLGIGGHMLFSKKAPKTIGERLSNKTPLKFYSAESTDNDAKAAWTTKMNSYSTSGAQNVNADILPTSDLTEVKFSNKCKEILAIKWDKESEELKKKEAWASNWCFTT